MSDLLKTLGSYIPALIVRRLAADPTPISAPVSTRHLAAMLFADISGFTPLTERYARRGPAGVEELSQLLNTYFGQLSALVHDHGGDVIKFAGDGLLALWSTEDTGLDLETATMHAAQCGLAVQEALHGLEAVEGMHLSLRVGVGCGDVIIVHIGGSYKRWEFLVAGPAVAQVSAAERQALPGQVLDEIELGDAQFQKVFVRHHPGHADEGRRNMSVHDPPSLHVGG